jgi:hypothetical protein
MEPKKIDNIKQLRAEIARLKAEAELQEQKINFNFQSIQESLRPENIIKNLFARITSENSAAKNILLRAMNFGLSLFLQRFAVRAEHKVEEKIFDLLGSAFSRFSHFFKKKKKKENGRP